MKYFVSLFFAIFVLVAISFFAVSNFDALKNSASLFFAQLSSTREIREKHTTDKVKILLVPGHEEDFGGKEYRGIKERDLNVLLANHLYDLFSKDKGVAILNVKDNKGNFSKWFSDYTKENELAIKEFRNSVRANFKKAINDGFEIKNTVTHNKAPSITAFNLYAVNKYANDNDIDIVLHIHFNDNPRPNTAVRGKYNGFAIYVAEDQLPNAEVSQSLAKEIKNRLSSFVAVSDFKPEKWGIVKSQSLIAVGSNASRHSASVLVEYSYIYEPQIVSEEIRPLFIKELALQTYLGINDYLKGKGENSLLWPVGYSILLPNKFENAISRQIYASKEAFLLQMALRKDGLYPPTGKTLNDCPLSGVFGPCTEESVRLFQEKYSKDILLPFGLSKGTGHVGKSSLNKLNSL